MAKTNKGRKFFATTATAALVASAIVPVASAAQVNDFNSIASYAQEAVQDLVDRGVVQGDANGNFQPRKSVSRAEAATILTGALGLETSAQVNFTDVKAGAWYYDAINAAVNNGVFSGKGAGIFEPNGNLTRGEAAIILVNAFNLEGSAPLAQFADEKSVKAWAVESLEIAVGNGVILGDNGKIKANDAITKQDFAVMFARAEAAADAVSANSVKVINATTVEVTFPEAVTNLSAVNFAIEGLTIENKVVKQTDSKTVVLTTSAQEGGKEYTVTVDDKAVGKFTGIAAVIPTAINVDTASVQGVIGKDVTVKASVTVPEGQSKAGIPVTFNIVSDNSNLNNKIEVVEYTDENGVASHTYTRYYSHVDNVAAYATQKSSVVSNGKVYWADKIQLAVTEITTGNELANGTKKAYKVNGAPNATYYIAIKENLGKTPDKYLKDVFVQDAKTGNFETPYELTTGATSFATVKTNSLGEGSFTVHGDDVEVTPVVYSPESTPTTPATFTYNKLDLQAAAPTVKFSQVNLLALTVVAEGTADAAQFLNTPVNYNDPSVGGREYTVTVTDTKGNLAPAGTKAYVSLANFNGDVYFTTGTKPYVKAIKDLPAQEITVGNDGKAKFRVAGKGNAAYVTPTVFLNTTGNVATPALDKTDVQQASEATYFKAANVVNGELTVKDIYGRNVTTLGADQVAYFTYQSVDQNGFPYVPTFTTGTTTQTVWVPVYGTDAEGNQYIIRFEERVLTEQGSTTTSQYTLAFDVTSLYGNVTVTDVAGNALQNLGNTKTYRVTSDAQGKAIVRVKATGSDTVSVNVTGVNNYLPTKSASVSFVATSTPLVLSGKVTLANAVAETVLLGGHEISYKDSTFKYGDTVLSKEQFFDLLTKNTLVEVRAVKDANGVYHYTINNVANPGIEFTSSTNAVANNIETLGLVGATATSSNPSVATVEIANDKIEITSVGAGDATITVKAGDKEATIPVTVSATGTITLGAITEAETEDEVTDVKVEAISNIVVDTPFTGLVGLTIPLVDAVAAGLQVTETSTLVVTLEDGVTREANYNEEVQGFIFAFSNKAEEAVKAGVVIVK